MTHWSSESVLSVVKNAPEDLLHYYDLISTIPIVVKRLLFPFLDICKPICGKNETGNATRDMKGGTGVQKGCQVVCR